MEISTDDTCNETAALFKMGQQKRPEHMMYVCRFEDVG